MRGDYFWNNNQLLTAEKWDEASNCQGTVVYEVLRIIDGVPLFFEDHYQRLLNSCKLIGVGYEPEKKELFRQFTELAKANNFKTGNVILKLYFETGELNNSGTQELRNSLLYFIPHSYPSEIQYKEGVTVDFLFAERNNPEAKVEQGVREKANEMLKNSKLYEVLLVDRNGFITEGSKSNMVFVKNNTLYTCPLERVLTGITLKKVIDIANTLKIPVVFEAIKANEIDRCDALFITGTSPKILPVAKAGTTLFDVANQVVCQLHEMYDSLIENDISSAKQRNNAPS
jgi:branched-chain amino acid aminotransferase